MSDKPFGIADLVASEARSPAAVNEPGERKEMTSAEGRRNFAPCGVLLEAPDRPDTRESKAPESVDKRAALLRPRSDVWVKRPATV